LLPSTALTLLLVVMAFLKFYDQTDFEFLGLDAVLPKSSFSLTSPKPMEKFCDRRNGFTR
jgi:hypothetical protein